MLKKDFHVVYSGKEWLVKRGGVKLSSHRTQKNAKMSAIARAEHTKSEIIVYEKGEKIIEK